MDELMIKVENVSKQYRLGQIGGTTLREELQRKAAKLLKTYNKEPFHLRHALTVEAVMDWFAAWLDPEKKKK